MRYLGFGDFGLIQADDDDPGTDNGGRHGQSAYAQGPAT
jgi:hypothetical protein